MPRSMPQAEFIVLVAMMFATIAFSMDAMLPALPEIAKELSPDNANQAQLILGSFAIGMGLGTLIAGPLSDAFGRKPVIFFGSALYILSAGLAWLASSLELVLFARVMQGLGAAAPRVVTLAIVRDLYSGRTMARIISIAMMIFVLVPAAAPLMGQGIILLSDWRGIFLAFILFSIICVIWMGLRLPESLPLGNRRPFRPGLLWAAMVEVVIHPSVRISIIVQTLSIAALFCVLVMVQPIYDTIYGRAESFPLWFGLAALLSGSASLLNAAIVVRVGMRRVVTAALVFQLAFAAFVAICIVLSPKGKVDFAVFLAWQVSLFMVAGMTLGNLNAIAMEPMGHIAGMAASVFGAVSTFAAAFVAASVGLMFNGTLWPLTTGILVLTALALCMMLRLRTIVYRSG